MENKEKSSFSFKKCLLAVGVAFPTIALLVANVMIFAKVCDLKFLSESHFIDIFWKLSTEQILSFFLKSSRFMKTQ